MLEINDHPSLNISLCKEGQKGLLKQASEVDRVIKSIVIGDAIKLMRKQNFEMNEFKCWQKILPHVNYLQMNLVIKCKQVFEEMATTQELQSGRISSSSFCKMAKLGIKGMSDRTTLELLFKKIAKM